MDMHWTPEPNKQDLERECRVSKLLTLEISSSRHPRTKVVVRNISPHGLGARSDIDLVQCEHVTVHLPNAEDMGAIVRWVKKGTFGLALDGRIEPDMLQPRSHGSMHLDTRDAPTGFQRLEHKGSTERSGFQRSHRDQVLHGGGIGTTSHWISD